MLSHLVRQTALRLPARVATAAATATASSAPSTSVVSIRARSSRSLFSIGASRVISTLSSSSVTSKSPSIPSTCISPAQASIAFRSIRCLSSTASVNSSVNGTHNGKASSSTGKELPKEEQPTDDDGGMNLFAQAMASQKQRDQKKTRDQTSNAEGHTPNSNPEDIEAERIRRLNESTRKEDTKRLGDNAVFYSGVCIASLFGMYIYMGMSSENDKDLEGVGILEAHNRRVWEYIVGCYKYWTEPNIKKLLPEPLPEGQQPPFTLLIEHNDALLHLVWDKAAGWRAAVRPGAKHFMANMRKYFEVVIFTSTPGYLSQPVLEAFDPNYYAPYRLYREHTTLEGGDRVKDLSILNRDLGKVILIDTNENSYRLQPENGINIKPWHGEAGDTELKRMETFLEEFSFLLAISQAQDVRPFLKTLRELNGTIPDAWDVYKQRLRKLTSERDESPDSEVEHVQHKPPAQPNLFSIVGSLIGLNRPLTSTAAAAQAQPVFNLVDTIERLAREERQLLVKQLEDEKKHIAEMQKLQEEMIRKQTEENKAQKLTMFDAMMGGGQPQMAGQPSLQESSSPA
ncbi:hypothetical protein BASA61_000304 [Batrachochytrium salamandrivorans]|nr:hypothetical protein BASA61_000304 [Batrachochytrium salamandrivorans]